jgi:hypothetical protein
VADRLSMLGDLQPVSTHLLINFFFSPTYILFHHHGGLYRGDIEDYKLMSRRMLHNYDELLVLSAEFRSLQERNQTQVKSMQNVFIREKKQEKELEMGQGAVISLS